MSIATKITNVLQKIQLYDKLSKNIDIFVKIYKI